MAENPFNVSRKLFKWLDLPWVTEVEQYISDHTTVNEERSDSTHRQLRTRIARWRNDTNWKYNKDAATDCQEVLHSFGYLVLGNLIGNAIRYNRPGGKVQVEWDEETRSLGVRDTGHGIVPEMLPHIPHSPSCSISTWRISSLPFLRGEFMVCLPREA